MLIYLSTNFFLIIIFTAFTITLYYKYLFEKILKKEIDFNELMLVYVTNLSIIYTLGTFIISLLMHLKIYTPILS